MRALAGHARAAGEPVAARQRARPRACWRMDRTRLGDVGPQGPRRRMTHGHRRCPTRRRSRQRGEFHQAMRDAFAAPRERARASCGCRSATSPTGRSASASVDRSLARWADSHRRLTVLAAQTSTSSAPQRAGRVAPPLVARRRMPEQRRARGGADAGLLARVSGCSASACSTRCTIAERSRRAIRSVRCREQIDALLQRSVEAFPVTTLGL